MISLIAITSGKSANRIKPLTFPVDGSASAVFGNPTEPIGPSSIDRLEGFFNLHSALDEKSEAIEITGSGIVVTVLTPLFQTNFLPDLKHVKVLPDVTEVSPAFVHAPPALAAAFTGIRGRDIERESIDKKAISFLFKN